MVIPLRRLFGSGEVTHEVGEGALVVLQPDELGLLLGAERLVAGVGLVESLGPLVDLLLEGLEHLELGGGRDAVVIASAVASSAAAAAPPPPPPPPASRLSGLRASRSCLNRLAADLASALGILVGLRALEPLGRVVHARGRFLRVEAKTGAPSSFSISSSVSSFRPAWTRPRLRAPSAGRW